MLFDALLDEKPPQAMYAVLKRRVTYLAHRAETVMKRESEGDTQLWRQPVAAATLWMEAAEGAVALDDFEQARAHLRRAADLLLALRLPYGAAIQRMLLPEDDTLAGLAEGVIKEWYWRSREQAGTKGRDQPDHPFAAVARDTAVQWVFLTLTESGADSKRSLRGDYPGSEIILRTHAAVPIGRLRLPIDHYRLISEFCADAVRQGDVTEARQHATVEAIATMLDRLHRTVQWASKNTYLWTRLLAPAPLFDLDAAMLIARLFEAQQRLRKDMLGLVQHRVPDNSRHYAVGFIRAVRLIRNFPSERDLAQ